MEKVYIHQQALLSAADIVSRNLEESLEILQDRVSSQDPAVGCAGVSLCVGVVTLKDAHIHTCKHLFVLRQQVVRSPSLSLKCLPHQKPASGALESLFRQLTYVGHIQCLIKKC